MSLLDTLVHQANQLGASDLHLEAGLPATLRVNGQLRALEGPVAGRELAAEANALLQGDAWDAFVLRRSADLSRTIAGVRCRMNVFHSARGVGFAIRLLHPFQATLETLNLHPDLGRLVQRPHGLLVVSGPTGSGKSSTVAALVEEINRTRAEHVVTLEEPVEHTFRPRRSFIRQREVGRDTPSFHQGLMDALREDPDVIVVGEVRDADTIRLALTAAETGHLVITTLHAGTAVEALTRIVASFAPEAQPAVAAALAETLIAVVSQRLYFRADLGIRVPEAEVLVANEPVKAIVRQAGFARLANTVQTGAHDGMWTFERWRRWQESRERLFVRSRDAAREPLPEEPSGETPVAPSQAPPPRPLLRPRTAPPPRPARAPSDDGVLELEESHEDLASLVKKLR
jgi:twitching motility protein PilT